MILLITTANHGEECGSALKQATGETVRLVASVREALALVRQSEWSLVVVDERSVETEAKAVEVLLEHLGPAIPVFVNLAISGAQRLVRDVLVARKRASQQQNAARQASQSQFASALRNDLTAILLSSDLALRDKAISAESRNRVKAIRDLAGQMRSRLA